ncbi:hypothetical protein MSAN_02054900 [Mycena sanguinolenta]|uniref:DUF6535 domain-containing protein n=1 Tax=Mycena sanguinolenta TaxID=230812 RepID=A0A8H6XJ25_9AGAR|nr:hypothetical protein MSAN_02054900 [Mycena sanguinolenta]
MDPEQALEFGTGGRDLGKGSVLHRLVSAASWKPRPGPRTSTSKTDKPAISRSNPEKGDYSDAENEEACAKVWSIYVGEAERYDTALVESWRADMEGMLFFSGLFSASLTAFLIESYRALQPDSGDLMVAGITQLSHQLAAIASNRTFIVPPSPSFTPTAGSLWCNALWFISLSLSLTCALLATLVEQWAREFLHKTRMRPSPLRRARVFSFLYFGLKRFRMHTIVDSIPFLLHASLFFFFAGLVAFLLAINRIMMYLICVALVVFLVLYVVLTILPVVRLDCPYRTPLSAFLWSMIQNPFGLFNDSESSARRTMTEAVGDLALKDTKLRDQRALQWTLDSLTDDTELLRFVEAILDIIYGPQGFRRENDALFESLLGTVDVASPLVTRIGAMIVRTQGMPQESPLRVHRYTAGHRALWALCMMPSAWNRLFELDQTLLAGVPGGLAASTSLAVRYQAQRWVHGLLGTLCDLLGNHHPSTQVLALVQRLVHLLISHPDPVISPFESLFAPVLPNPCSVPFAELEAMYGESRDSMQTIVDLDKTRCIVTALYDLHDWAYNSLVFMGMFISTALDDLHLDESDTPFEPLETCYTILSEIESNPPKRSVTEIVITFPTIHNVKFSRLNPPPQDTLARIVFRMLPFFSSCGILEYLVKRRNAQAIQYVLTECDLRKLAQAHIMIESTMPTNLLSLTWLRAKGLDAVVRWFGRAPLAHAYTILIASRNHDSISDKIHRTPRYAKMEPQVATFDIAWEYQLSRRPFTFVDVDKECLGDFEERLFEYLKQTGQAGHEQWGLDVGHHQDGWNPYNGLPEHWNHEDRPEESESELQPGPNYIHYTRNEQVVGGLSGSTQRPVPKRKHATKENADSGDERPMKRLKEVEWASTPPGGGGNVAAVGGSWRHLSAVGGTFPVPDSVAIAFVDAVFAQLSQDAVQKYSAIGTVRYFRRLREANNELDEIRFSSLPPAALLPRIQKICHSELFQEISPLFLPRDVHIPTALESSQIHLANKYIAFLAEFLQNNSIPTAKVNLRVFDRFFAPASFEWTTVERAIQHGFLAAILAHTKVLAAEPHSRSDMLAISKQLWGSDLFWINWLQGGWSPTVAGIDQSGLELLYESLELYLAAVVPPQGEHSMSVHITDSKRLLAEVQKQLSSTHVVRPSNDSGNKAGASDEAAEGTSSEAVRRTN